MGAHSRSPRRTCASRSAPGVLQIAWTQSLPNSTRGLALARERGWVLVWDDKHWLYLLNHAGAVQLARRIAAALRIEVGGAAPQLRVGYDAVANLRYSPIDPAKFHNALFLQPASCRLRQAGSLRSPAPTLSC